MARAAHGNAARLGRLTASECRPSDELPPATPLAAVRNDRDSAGRFVRGNRVGAARRVKAGSRGALVELERKGDPAARAALAFGRRYAAHRRTELARCHGGELSAGVGAMVESAGELLAQARYWSARSIADADPDHARLAATLVAGARQAERDAWELASREAAARPKARETYSERVQRQLRERLTSGATSPATDHQNASGRHVAPAMGNEGTEP